MIDLLQYVISKNSSSAYKATANAAISIGIDTEFFDSDLARDLQMRILVLNNVLAHVPDINDFMLGIKRILK